MRPTVLAYYFPNWHSDPRNERWFGEGWTEWDLLRSAVPRFPKHRQPRVPAHGYQDESDPGVAAQHIALARDHGVDGFLVDYYWYDDGPYLQGALDRGLLQAPNADDVSFALMWANHELVDIFPTHRREGTPPPRLENGAISADAFDRMTDHIIEAYFSRSNYLRVEGKPWFSVYEIGNLIAGLGGVEETRAALDRFREKTIAAGHPGLHLDAVVWGFGVLPTAVPVRDAAELIDMLGFVSATSYVWIHHASTENFSFPEADSDALREEAFADYERLADSLSVPLYPNVTVGWDSSPRTVSDVPFERGRYPFSPVWDQTPAQFRAGLQRAERFLREHPTAHPVVTINAWNEWTEGSALLPDTDHGTAFLDAVRDVFGRVPQRGLARMSSAPRPSQLAVERRSEGLGIGTASPRLSWVIESAPPGWAVEAAQARSIDTAGNEEIAEIGARGLVENWPFAALESAARRTVSVRVRDTTGNWSPWSEPLDVEAGLLARDDWVAEFVAAPWEENTRVDQAPPLLRGTVPLRGSVRAARLRSTSLGLHAVELDGEAVSDELLAPGWTSYDHRLRYSTVDITPRLQAAVERGQTESVIGAWLGDGWYRGRLGWNDRVRNVWGDTLAVLVQVEIEYADGLTEVVGSDSSWLASRGPILRSGLYDGERYDAALLPRGWSMLGADVSAWAPVRVIDRPRAELVAADGPPVRVIESIEPIAITDNPGGSVQIDFGQNIVGRVRVRPTGVGQMGLRARHAEVMQDGELSLRPLRTAEALDTWWPEDGASAPHEWAPRFTFHGFRHVDIEGWLGTPAPDEVVAEVIHSDMRRTGWFRSSDPLLNRLHENVVWGMRGNFVDIPTDCPQRDERLGWTGDLQVFGPTAAFLYDCSGVLRSWLRDVALEQRPSGSIPHFVPDVPRLDPEDGFTAIWGDVAAITPWDLYTAFGDLGMLAEQYPAARRWVEGLREIAGESFLISEQFQYGDWLDPTAPPEDALAAKADPDLIASLYFFRSTTVLAASAEVLGKPEDAQEYRSLAARVQAAVQDRYVSDTGRLSDDAQASYALAIRFGLFTDGATRQAAGDRLSALVRENAHKIGTGFAGTPVICDALADTGHLDDAYAMLQQTECPSWLYSVTQGATTIWERWDSLLPNGRVNTGGMTSFNHYALGAVADFLHRVVAGIAPAAPGYEKILFRPRPGGTLTSAGADLETPFGRASIDWTIKNGMITLDLRVPVGTTAVLDLEEIGGERTDLSHGTHQLSLPTRK